MVTVDVERCTGCGVCVEACPTGTIQLAQRPEGWYAQVDSQQCRECEACVAACPEGAIAVASEPTIEGEIAEVKARPLPAQPQSRDVAPTAAVPKAVVWLSHLPAGSLPAMAGQIHYYPPITGASP